MPARDWAELQALDAIDPFGPARGDLRMAVLASLIANINRDPKKTKPFKPRDFLLFVEPEQKKRTAQSELRGFLAAKRRKT